jgi:hypothetical protein
MRNGSECDTKGSPRTDFAMPRENFGQKRLKAPCDSADVHHARTTTCIVRLHRSPGPWAMDYGSWIMGL